MQRKLLQILACPACLGELTCTAAPSAGGEIEDGALTCAACQKSYPIIEGIPRFVPVDNYAGSFGYQWNLFRQEQIDSANGTRLSEQRLYFRDRMDEGVDERQVGAGRGLRRGAVSRRFIEH